MAQIKEFFTIAFKTAPSQSLHSRQKRPRYSDKRKFLHKKARFLFDLFLHIYYHLHTLFLLIFSYI